MNYRDQTDVFYASPLDYLEKYFPAAVDPAFPPSVYPVTPPGSTDAFRWSHTWPSHIVFFGALLENDGIKGRLNDLGYREVWAKGNGIEEDRRRRGGVRVWKWMS